MVPLAVTGVRLLVHPPVGHQREPEGKIFSHSANGVPPETIVGAAGEDDET
jgi:hypothetical protein